MSVFNKRRDKDVDIEALWAAKMKKNPSLKRLNPPGSAADMMQAIEYDWDLHYKEAQKDTNDDPWWDRMFMTDSEDDTEKMEMVTQMYPYLKREEIRTKKRKGEAFASLVKKYWPLLVPEDRNDFRKGAERIEKEYHARGGSGPTEGEAAAMMALKIFRRVMEADKGPGGTELRTSEDACWLSCVYYTTAYVEDVRVTPGSAENITYPEPGRDYSIIIREDLGGPPKEDEPEKPDTSTDMPPADATLDQE